MSAGLEAVWSGTIDHAGECLSACRVFETDADLVGAGGFKACLEAVFRFTVLRATLCRFTVLAGSISTLRCRSAEATG